MNASAPQRIGLLGGSFDPVHHGHLAMARAALQTGRLDAVWFVPAAASPFKIGAMHARAEDRVAMLRLAIGSEPRFAVSQFDLDRGGVSYTIELIEALRRAYPELAFTFLIGADSLFSLSRWYRAKDLVKLCDFLSFGRRDVTIHPEALGFDAETNRRLAEGFYPQFDLPVSSTEIRAALQAGKPVDTMVPPAVAAYIEAHGLYRT